MQFRVPAESDMVICFLFPVFLLPVRGHLPAGWLAAAVLVLLPLDPLGHLPARWLAAAEAHDILHLALLRHLPAGWLAADVLVLLPLDPPGQY